MGAKRRKTGLSAAAVLAVLSSVAAQDAGRTLRDGVFSSAQAARGEQLFESICASCHDMAEFRAAGAYLEDVEGKPLWETFEYISAEMPEDDPASLRPEEYAAVLAYIFSVYGLPSGPTDLPVEQLPLEAISIVRPAPPGS